MNSLFSMINRTYNSKNVTIISKKEIVQIPPKLSLEPAGAWEKEEEYINKNSVSPILSYYTHSYLSA